MLMSCAMYQAFCKNKLPVHVVYDSCLFFWQSFSVCISPQMNILTHANPDKEIDDKLEPRL